MAMPAQPRAARRGCGEIDTQLASGLAVGGSTSPSWQARPLTIPKIVHFCWIGSRLPWAYAFAVLSAAARGGMDEVILHHTDELEDGPVLRALCQTPGIRLSRTDPRACLAPVQAGLGLAEGLTGLYGRLSSPVMRADVLRAAILYSQGGVYLDLDTLTV